MRDGVAPRTRQEREPRGAWLGARRIGRELRLSHARRSAALSAFRSDRSPLLHEYVWISLILISTLIYQRACVRLSRFDSINTF